MKTFLHAGDLGDIVLSLPVIRHCGGGELLIKPERYTRQLLTPEVLSTLAPLLRTQPYITNVRHWIGENVDVDLNQFRPPYFSALRKDINKYRGTSLAYWYSTVFDVPITEWDKPWINLPVYEPSVPVVMVNRSARYHNPRFPWNKVFEKYKEIIFVGLPEEAEAMGVNSTNTDDPVHYRPTADLLEVAKGLQHCALFVGNQSACHAIAKGLGKPFVLEVFPQMPNCVYAPQPFEWYGFDENAHLPDLKDLP